MTKSGNCLILTVVLSILLSPSEVPMKNKNAVEEDAGFVSEINGTCWLQRKGSEMRITRKKFGGATLKVGDKLRCDKGGALVIELKNLRTTIESSNEWTTVRRASGRRKDAMADPIDDWFKLAGGTRGFSAGLYSPPSGGYGGAVWPDRLVIRWTPPSTPGELWFKILDEFGAQLWPENNEQGLKVSSDTGELTSKEARQILVAYRQNRGQGPLTLTMVDSEGKENRVEFSIISHADEDNLKAELSACSSQPGITKYICDAYYFRRLKLYVEAADEYDAALKLAPEGVDLQLHAIAEHRLTGNYAREQELLRQLPPGTQPPN